MAAIDSTVPMTHHGATAITITDGSNTVTIVYTGSFSWTETGRSVTEARDRGRHKSTPVIVETEDNDCAISFTGMITSFLGSSNTHLYEALTRTGNAAAWTSTGVGNAYTYTLTATFLNGEASGGSQTLTFTPCHTDSLALDGMGADGLMQVDATITAYINRPTVA
jgi:hypothetical protein